MVVFDYAMIYKVEAECTSPLHTGDSLALTEEILLRSDGKAIIQGNSLAGAMKEYARINFPDSYIRLFGGDVKREDRRETEMVEGHLIISDGVFDDARVQLRPRVRINSATGAAMDGGKYDIKHIAAGNVFEFTITWLGNKDGDASGKGVNEDAKVIEQILSAMNNGLIRLGAYKTSGYGKVSLTVSRECFDMKNAGERQAWLNNEFKGSRLELASGTAAPEGMDVEIVVKGRMPSALVKAGSDSDKEYEKTDGNKGAAGLTHNIIEDYEYKTAGSTGKVQKYAVIPGSSIKGVVRNRVNMIAGWYSGNKHSDSIGKLPDMMFGSADNGDGGSKGCIYFDELKIHHCEKVNTKVVSRIRINKFTGGVMGGALVNEEIIGDEVELHIHMPEKPQMCALLMYALRDLGLGLYNIGSGQSIGRGYVDVDEISVKVGSRKAELRFDKDRNVSGTDESGLLAQWIEALEV